jgi:hypothetical protein
MRVTQRWMVVALIGGLLAWQVPDARAQSRCVTKWNSVLRQYETVCDDGGSARERYNTILDQWEQTIMPPPARFGEPPTVPHEQRCVQKFNRVLRQWERWCE